MKILYKGAELDYWDYPEIYNVGNKIVGENRHDEAETFVAKVNAPNLTPFELEKIAYKIAEEINAAGMSEQETFDLDAAIYKAVR